MAYLFLARRDVPSQPEIVKKIVDAVLRILLPTTINLLSQYVGGIFPTLYSYLSRGAVNGEDQDDSNKGC